MKSLLASKHALSDSKAQLELLNSSGHEPFETKLAASGLGEFKAKSPDILQLNVGKMCNQTCKHCHVDAGPDRKEIMTRETMEACLDFIDRSEVKTVDLTGGAPELNPNFRWLVEALSERNVQIIDRCNLTIILANKRFNDLPDFFAEHKVQVVSSLPHYTAFRTDRQRGNGVFEQSIAALKMLNAVGYGEKYSGLELNLVYNPTGAILPGPQSTLEDEYKKRLKTDFDIDFNQLFVITNMPISRFLDYLVASENYQQYMDKLIEAYNPAAIDGLMCLNTLSVGWDGYLYDCDFNQMLDMKIAAPRQHISNIQLDDLIDRKIEVNQHCYGCTAGMGSSCGGQVV